MRSCRARHRAEWSIVVQLNIDHGMSNEMPQTFARRARLSSKAIIAAIALTVAALGAIVIASRDNKSGTIKILSPVTHLPALESSSPVPVVDR